MKDFFNWLITSSSDPRKTSLAVKGALILAGSQLVRVADAVCSFGLYCLGINIDLVNQVAQGAEMVVYGGLLLWGGVWLVVGVCRKFYLGRWSHPDAI